jgi:hypothetical protein
MLAIAVSSEAMARAVKIAATAQRLRSGGSPSVTGAAGPFAAAKSVDIRILRTGDECGRASGGMYYGYRAVPMRRFA